MSLFANYLKRYPKIGSDLVLNKRFTDRPRKGLEDVNGFMAVLLWREYKRGNSKALETLLAYNIADAVNLETLMVRAYNEKLACTPFDQELRLTLPEPPEIPYKPDRKLVRRLANWMLLL